MSTVKLQYWKCAGYCKLPGDSSALLRQCIMHSMLSRMWGDSSSSLVFPKMPASIHHSTPVTWAIPPCFCDSTEITAQDLHNTLLTVPVSSPQCSEWVLLGDIQAHLFRIKGMKAFSSITLSHRYFLIHIHTLGANPLELIATCLLFTALWALCLPTIIDHFFTWQRRTFSLPYVFGIKLFLLEVKIPWPFNYHSLAWGQHIQSPSDKMKFELCLSGNRDSLLLHSRKWKPFIVMKVKNDNQYINNLTTVLI